MRREPRFPSVSLRLVDHVQQRLAGGEAAGVLAQEIDHPLLFLQRVARGVRRDQAVLQTPERAVGRQRLGLGRVERRPGGPAPGQRLGQGGVVDQRTREITTSPAPGRIRRSSGGPIMRRDSGVDGAQTTTTSEVASRSGSPSSPDSSAAGSSLALAPGWASTATTRMSKACARRAT